MLSFNVDADALGLKIEKVTQAATRAFNAAVLDAWHEVLDSTPERSGFLRASWYVRINGSPGSHPARPSLARKSRIDYARPWRRLPMQGARKNAYDEEWGMGEAGKYVGIGVFENRTGPREVRSRDIGVRQTVEFINTAPTSKGAKHAYLPTVDAQIGFEALAQARAAKVFRSTFQKRMRAELRRRGK